MKILLSAYACEPNKGSEPGVWWSWATEYAKQHQVWVVTRDNNEPTIKKYLEEKTEYNNENLHFIYVGLPRKLTFWKKGRRGMRLFYMLWQRKAAKVVQELNKKEHFDFVQHVTFVSYTQPSYMYKVGVPLIWGPVSGGENIPKGIKIKMNKKEAIVEAVRKASQTLALYTPSIRKTMKTAKIILTATEETQQRIPQKYQKKTHIMPAIGIEQMPEPIQKCQTEKIKIIMAGRLIYWKAFDIGIKAFLQIAEQYPEIELHILGEGNQKKKLQKLAGKYLDNRVFFEKAVQHDEIYQFYSQFDLFVNTTLRDSGCMTMMEAMSVGLPCIAIATGGPTVLLGAFEECRINPFSFQECVDSIAEIIGNFVTNRSEWDEIAQKQRSYIEDNLMLASKMRVLNYILESKR